MRKRHHQDIPWYKRMLRIIIPIRVFHYQRIYASVHDPSARAVPVLTAMYAGFILSTTLDYFDEMGLYAFSSAINLILIVTILIFNFGK
ncbi:MAG: hypothetical protein ACLTUF_00700 [Waltera sp.]